MQFPLLPFAAAFIVSVLMIPFLCRGARRIGLIDGPDGHRKLQPNSVPVCGGVAVFVAFAVAVGGALLTSSPWASDLSSHPALLTALLIGAAGLCLVGVVDDYYGLRGRQKLAAQVVVAAFVAQAGMRIELIEVLQFRFELGVFALPLTVLWLLGSINATNLIDGADGVAGSAGMIFSVALSAMAWSQGQVMPAVCGMALAGALLGFLVFNLPPAKVYLGDAGSMTIGMILGVLAIQSSLKGPAVFAIAAPLAIWTIPAFDVAMAILRRGLTGQSLFATDRRHLHHVLQSKGYNRLWVVSIISLLCVVCAVAAFMSVLLKSEIIALAAVGAVLSLLVVTRVFGHAECVLLAKRVGRLAQSMWVFPRYRQNEHHDLSAPAPMVTSFAGSREWSNLWESLLLCADQFDICSLKLNISSPAFGEEYHAVWNRKESPPAGRTWSCEIPLLVDSVRLGRLVLRGRIHDGLAVTWLSELMEGLQPFELELKDMLYAGEPTTPALAG